jgi:hypothetical protein
VNGKRTLARQLAERLAEHAQSIMPRERGDWGCAMRNEIDHVKQSWDALGFAFGCVLTSYIERMTTMTDRFGASPWVLSLWMLCCFGWDSTLFVAAVASVLVGHGVLGFAGPAPVDADFWLTAAGAALGPVGLVLAFKAIVLGRPALSTTARVILGVASFATLIEAVAVFAIVPHPLENWHGYVLLVALPLLGAAHLAWLGKPAPASVALA